MRKLMLAVLISSLAVFSLSASVELTYDLFGRGTIVRDGQISGGLGVSCGVDLGRTRLELYFLEDYYNEPLGGDGFAARREFSLEPGVSVQWKAFSLWKINGYIGADLGWFIQLAELWQDRDAGTVLGEMGLMARFKLVAEFDFLKYWNVSLGAYYQMPLMPDYDDYRGIGIMVSII